GAPGRSATAALRVRLLADAADQVLLQLLPHFHVALGELVHHRPRRLAEHPAHLLAELLLLVEEYLHGALEIAAHEALHRIAVETDDLAQRLGGEHRYATVLVLGDDLQHHRSADVVPGLRLTELELLTGADQLAHILDLDLAGDLGVV